VAFTWDKVLLDSAGLSLDPEHAVKLAPAPDYGSLDVALCLNTSKKGVGMGPLEVVVPLAVKAGPPVLLTVRAEVVMPDMELSQTAIDFGTVRQGQCKVGGMVTADVGSVC
jgi:hypothetical protein